MFDNLILLKSGKIVYLGSNEAVLKFFAKAGFECPEHENPAGRKYSSSSSGGSIGGGGSSGGGGTSHRVAFPKRSREE